MKVEGALLASTSKAGAWASIAANTPVPLNQRLVALFGADFETANKAVHVRMVADIGQRGPLPVLESGISVHEDKAADLSMSIQAGIVVVTNRKKAGAAKVVVGIRGEIFDLTLADPGSQVGIEVYGRHIPGPAKLGSAKEDDPVTNGLFFALAGEAVVATSKKAARLHAPPGPALLLWDQQSREFDIRRFEKLPDSVRPMNEAERKKFNAVCALTKPLAQHPGEARKILGELIRSKESMARKTAVVALGATDDVPGLFAALSDADHADVRDIAVIVLRHWLGRDAGQSVRLFNFLTKEKDFTPTQAKNLLHLCHGIEEEKLRDPGTFDILIHGLNHARLPVRQLAHWHLVRLVPDGWMVAYDAAAAEPARQAAIAEWRYLVPEGELPRPAIKKKTMP